MPAPTVTTSSPASGDTGVYKNKVLSVTFSEALLESSVTATNFVLRNLDANERVPVSVSLNTSGTIVSVVPTRHLLANTAYRFTIVGASTGVVTAVSSNSDSTEMVTTVHITFTTGEEIETTQLEKTEAQIAAEGQIDLPANLIVVPQTSYLEVIGGTPQNKEVEVSELISEVIIVFSESVRTSTFANYITMSMEPYYAEDEDFLAIPTTSDGKLNFQWQEPTSQYRSFVFDDVAGSFDASGSTITWTPDSGSVFPNNSKVKIVIEKELTANSGNQMEYDQKIEFYIKPAPYVLTVQRIRDEFFPYVLSSWTDDMIGKTIYKNTLEILPYMRWQVRCDKINSYLREYVMYATIFDIFDGLRIEQELLAGQFKRLGDLTVRFDVRIPDAMPNKQKEALKKMQEIKKMLTARFTDIPLSFVKGAANPSQRSFLRTRLWRSDFAYSLEAYYSGNQTAGNTRDVRATKLPGALDPW